MNVLLYGSEPFLINQSLQELLKNRVGEVSQMNTIYYDFTSPSFSMTSFLEEADTMSFFSEHKVMILQNCVFLTRAYKDKEKEKNKERNDSDIQKLLNYLTKPHDQTTLIMMYEDDNIDTVKLNFKKIKETCDVIHINKLNPDQFRLFLQDLIKERQLRVTSEAFNELIKRLDDNMSVAIHECDKLQLFGQNITYDDVIALVSRPLDSEAFHLVNAILDKRLAEALNIWNDMIILNMDALAFIGLIASQLRIFYQVSSLNDAGKHREEIINELSVGTTQMNVYRVSRLLNLARMTTSKRLLKVLNALAEYDQKSKTGLVDKRFGFELFLIEATR
jgi:DNA polymerase III subunit delta